jgi:hypothetical protein
MRITVTRRIDLGSKSFTQTARAELPDPPQQIIPTHGNGPIIRIEGDPRDEDIVRRTHHIATALLNSFRHAEGTLTQVDGFPS